MSVDLTSFAPLHRLLFAIPLAPLQGKRFQATGFPGLGAATFQTKDGQCLLVESAQSTANRLEKVVWNEATQDLVADLAGLSHVRVLRGEGASAAARKAARDKVTLTDSIREAHRLNSPYVMFGEISGLKNDLFDYIGNQLNAFAVGPLPAQKVFAQLLLRLDIGTLIHGVFLASKKGKQTLSCGRFRISRALSAFIEADGVRVAASGGVKNDHVDPSGDSANGGGNVPFARDEFTADSITLYANLDLAQIRGYGLGEAAERLLILLALWKLRALLDGGLRLRTACDLQATSGTIAATNLKSCVLPDLATITTDLKAAITACASAMTVTTVAYDDDLSAGKGEDDEAKEEGAEDDKE